MMEPIVIGGSSIAAAAAFGAYAVRGRSSQIFGRSVYHGDRSSPVIALTFDDGPSESTPGLLALLKIHKIRATFFMCGKNAARLPHIARAVAEAGHEIGNHSDTHPRFDFCSSEFIYRELATAQETISRATGVTPRLFRAPYGVRWFGIEKAQARLNLTGVMWSIIGRDWKWPDSRIASLLSEKSRPGDIVCLHDGRLLEPGPDIRPTMNALASAIPSLKSKGLGFDIVSAIIGGK